VQITFNIPIVNRIREKEKKKMKQIEHADHDFSEFEIRINGQRNNADDEDVSNISRGIDGLHMDGVHRFGLGLLRVRHMDCVHRLGLGLLHVLVSFPGLNPFYGD
jgi:hypothetical protein